MMKLGKLLLPRRAKNAVRQALVRIIRAEMANLVPPDLQGRVKDLETELHQVEGILEQELSLLPLPPKHLQRRVSFGYDADFVWTGHHTYRYLNGLLRTIDKQLSDFHTILDFGCGCGRMIRALRQRLPAQELFGTDIDGEAIAWLRENYASVGDFQVNPHLPPSLYADNTFDFIFSISIFTHLPEDMQLAWLAELQRITKPGGYLILTTHGEKHFHHLNPEQQARLKTHGFYYISNEQSTTEGLPAFYQVAFHSGDYIRREWSRYFEVVAIEVDGQDGWQDMVLARKRPDGAG
jgi:SAM-dependent methyltransferase